jgi:hypothetical protein
VDTYVLLGSTSGSDRAGPAEHDWYLKVYRYPELQAITTDYNFGHGIYALGVCLLEIGLWTALVLRRLLTPRCRSPRRNHSRLAAL